MFFKSKKFWIIAGIVVVVIVILISAILSGNKAPQHETVKVERGDLVQTVDVTGKIKSENDVSLQFETSGTIDRIYVVEGEEVKKGDVLAKLNLDVFNSQVAQAKANLEQKIAGVSEEQIEVSQKQVNASEVAYEKAKLNLTNISSLATENLNNSYNSGLDLLGDTYIKLFNTLKFAEELRDDYFYSLTQESINIKNEIQYGIKDPLTEAKVSLDLAKETKTFSDIDLATLKMDSTIKSTLDVLLLIKNASEGVNYKNVISTTDKATLDQTKLTISTSQISLTSFQNELSLLKLQNENNINSAELAVEEALASLELQQANYDSLVATPREVDLAYFRSVLEQAIINRNKGIIVAPISGTITNINKEEGELISSAEALIEMLSPSYQIEVNIPETDIVKISVADKADIELDALSDKTLKAEVVSVNPAANTIQDVVYYKVVLSILEDDERVKPGMTADILIYTDERNGVLYLPSRSILTEGNRKYVRVLENGEIVEKEVSVGLNADDSKKEILSGVNEGEEIILKIAE